MPNTYDFEVGSDKFALNQGIGGVGLAAGKAASDEVSCRQSKIIWLQY